MGKKKKKNSEPKTQKGMIRHGIFGIEEVLSQTVDIPDYLTSKGGKSSFKKKHNAEINGVNVYMTSDRYTLFKHKGCTCVQCGREGKFFALESDHGSLIPRAHFNLYAIDEDGTEVLMTKDHIMAASKGGPNTLANYQPMCTFCNKEKGAN